MKLLQRLCRGPDTDSRAGDATVECDRLVESQLRLRRIIGLFGVSLPFFVVLGEIIIGNAEGVLGSVSEYYGSTVRNEFVGIMCVIGMFLFSYKGYDHWDDRVSYLAGIAAVAVAWLP